MWTKFAKMSVREAMIVIAGKPGYGEQPRWFEKVADVANISKRAARSLWRGEISSDDHRAARAVREAAERLERERAYKTEKAALANLLQQYAGRLRATDEAFHQPHLDFVEHIARALGSRD